MKHACPSVIALGSLLLIAAAPLAVADDSQPVAGQIGQQVAPFALRDYRGKEFSLAQTQGQRAVVVAFLGVECPLASLYAPRLSQLAERFGDRGVTFVGIDANAQDAVSEMAHFAKTHDIKFPLLKDVGNKVADSIGATRTPEVFLLDADHRVRYHGRIDDQYIVGRQRKQPTREDLVEAIEELLADKQVSQPATAALGCLIGRVKQPQADAQVTYSKHVAPILNAHCLECHRQGEVAPFAMTSYDEVAGWADTILETVDDNRMPPWHADPQHGQFVNDRRLSAEQKQTLHDWVAAGAPEGDPNDLPPPPKFAEGWRLPRVDQVVYMSEEEFDVPAEGTVAYQYFSVDPGFTEDKWIQAAECRAGNRAVVHHVLVGYRTDEGKRDRSRVPSEWLSATAPGARPLLLPDGMAKFVPKGAKLLFQLHYTPNGTPQKDRSSIALMFADAASVRKEVGTAGVENHFLLIPPGAADYRAEASHKFTKDTLLLSFFPHMHLRGKSFRYEAEYADGTREILLDVPHYDFNWQNTYELAQPKRMPKGSKLHCVAHYDNSADNLANPNPKRAVMWGDQTWEEMMIGYVDITPADPSEDEPQSKPADDKVSASPRPSAN